MGQILLITGVPGSGKSTVARGVAEARPTSAHLRVDDLREIMVNGFAAPGVWTDETEVQFRRARAVAGHIARTYADGGVDVAVDDVCIPTRFPAHHAALLADPRVLRVVLRPPLEVVLDRLRARGGPWDEFFIESGAEWADQQLAGADLDGWTVLDTGDQDPAESIEHVARMLDR